MGGRDARNAFPELAVDVSKTVVADIMAGTILSCLFFLDKQYQNCVQY